VIPHSIQNKFFAQIFDRFVGLNRKEKYWRKIFNDFRSSKSIKDGGFAILFDNFAPSSIRSNRKIMLELLTEDKYLFKFMDDRLQNDRQFLMSLLRKNPDALTVIDDEVKIENVDLVIDAIPGVDPDDELSCNYIPDVLFANRDVVSALAMAGKACCNNMPENAWQMWSNDPEFCFVQNLAKSPPHLFNRVSYMKEVLSKFPGLLWIATGRAACDHELITMGFAHDTRCVQRKLRAWGNKGRDDKIDKYMGYLKEKLDPYDNFASYVLGNMLSSQSVESTGTCLTLLNQGHETSISYKRRLAECLGIPTGRSLQQLLQARQNLNSVLSQEG
jgi:Domain of unknown function (DUF4116)